jgi:hypothetical protein
MQNKNEYVKTRVVILIQPMLKCAAKSFISLEKTQVSPIGRFQKTNKYLYFVYNLVSARRFSTSASEVER